MKEMTEYDFPAELKYMTDKELEFLADQIRDFLLEKVSKTGGHLASNLGVVELSIALHKVFDSPEDRILWDVGHQSYVHKILTGRADGFTNLRQLSGLSGFPKREESPHDVYDAGHSSDSISVGLGIAAARDLNGDEYNVVPVIGDGALTGGVAYEALNNAAASKHKMIIIINDNQMSISKNVGGVTQHLRKLRISPAYTDIKKRIQGSLAGKGGLGDSLFKGLEKARDALKYTIFEKSMFENLGFKYYGPVDGHDIGELTEFLDAAKRIDESVVVHVVTKKGKGFRTIEENPDTFHGIGPFSLDTMKSVSGTDKPSWSKVFGAKLTEMAERDKRIVAVSAAMIDGTGLGDMKQKYPFRVFDVGIAEQHAVSFASGMALQGMRPFVAVYSTFLQRAYDEIMMNVCLQNLPVVFCVDRAGNVGEDGETHNGQFDLSYLSHMPNMTVMAPANDRELREMMEYALEIGTPCAIRYPRGACIEWNESDARAFKPVDGSCEIVREGKKVALLAAGKLVDAAEDAAEILRKKGISCKVVNARFIKPLDENGILTAVKGVKLIVTLEDNVISGGFGCAINSLICKNEKHPKIVNLGWPDKFIQSGKTAQLEHIYGLDAESVADRIIKEL